MSAEDAAEKGNDKKVDQALRDQQAQDAKVNKLLLLGESHTMKTIHQSSSSSALLPLIEHTAPTITRHFQFSSAILSITTELHWCDIYSVWSNRIL